MKIYLVHEYSYDYDVVHGLFDDIEKAKDCLHEATRDFCAKHNFHEILEYTVNDPKGEGKTVYEIQPK